MKALSLHTLCCLPISLTTDLQQETAQHFILLLLHYFDSISNNADSSSSLSMNGESDQLILVVLKRIVLLVEQCEIGLLSTKSMAEDIIKKVFALRCNSRVSEIKIRALWSRCLQLLTQNACNGDNTIGFLKGIIRKELCEDETSET